MTYLEDDLTTPQECIFCKQDYYESESTANQPDRLCTKECEQGYHEMEAAKRRWIYHPEGQE